MKYALINKTTGELVKRANKWPHIEDGVNMPVVGLDPDLEWLDIETLPRPEYDRTTHTAQKDSGGVLNGKWAVGWIVGELDARTIANNTIKSAKSTGFEFPPASGFRYPSTPEWMPIYNGALLAKAGLRYPRRVRRVDGTVGLLSNANEVAAFWAAGAGYVEAIQDAELDLIEEDLAAGGGPI